MHSLLGRNDVFFFLRHIRMSMDIGEDFVDLSLIMLATVIDGQEGATGRKVPYFTGFLLRTQSRHTTSITGKTDAASSPFWMLFSPD